MEIINTTLVETGNSWVDWFFFILLLILGLGALVCSVFAFIEHDIGAGLSLIALGSIAILSATFIFINHRVTDPYNKYDVIFTDEKINMKEFLDKYTITGQDGNIYHIEDKH